MMLVFMIQCVREDRRKALWIRQAYRQLLTEPLVDRKARRLPNQVIDLTVPRRQGFPKHIKRRITAERHSLTEIVLAKSILQGGPCLRLAEIPTGDEQPSHGPLQGQSRKGSKDLRSAHCFAEIPNMDNDKRPLGQTKTLAGRNPVHRGRIECASANTPPAPDGIPFTQPTPPRGSNL